MPKFLNHSNRVRYRTEKSLFLSVFVVKFVFGHDANQPLYSLKDKGVFGLVC